MPDYDRLCQVISIYDMLGYAEPFEPR